MVKLRIGLDVGTTAIKAAAYDPSGSCVAVASHNNKVFRQKDGFAEQDMDAVWQGVVQCLSEVVLECNNAEFSSIGICAQGDGLWAIDKNGNPAGNAILWNDTRAAADLEQLSKEDRTAPIGLGCGTSIWPGTSGMLWRWARDHKAPQYQNAETVFTCADWIGFKLTGAIGSDFSNASIPFLNLQNKSYAKDQFQALDCQDIEEKLVNPKYASNCLGAVNNEASKATGIPVGIPVSTGSLDLAAMLVGMGMNRPGQIMLIMGTTAVVNILTDTLAPTTAPVGAAALHPTTDVSIRILAPSTGAAAFDWFTALHPNSLGGETPDDIAEKLNTLVEGVPVGSNGVTFMPYLNGERAPFVSPSIRGGWHGISNNTTKAELGRAVMEGTALSLRHCFESESGLPTRPVQLTGGGSKNSVWCQIIADIIGQDVVVSPMSDQGLWGAACIGAAAAGLGDPIELAKRKEDTQTYRYHKKNHEKYSRVYKRYACISKALQTLQTELNSLEEQTYE